jgi:hypothetical protein
MKLRVETVMVGALVGLLVMIIWFAARSEMFDPTAGLVVISLLFVFAGFIGARRSGKVAGGLWLGFVAGLVSALTVPGDYLFFRTAPYFPFFDSAFLVDTTVVASGAVMLLALVGALLPGLSRNRDRLGRSIHAFIAAWRRDSELIA